MHVRWLAESKVRCWLKPGTAVYTVLSGQFDRVP